MPAISEFLNQLDQWALGVLMLLYQLMGVHDIPRELDPNWIVVERWVKRPDGHHQLLIESKTIQKQCAQNKQAYVIFPQSYLAVQKIYLDKILIYTNEGEKKWHLISTLDRPVVSCNTISESMVLRVEYTSYLEYFTSINSLFFVGKYPSDQFFFGTFYLLVGFASLCIALFCFIVANFFNEKNYFLLIMGISVQLLMYAHYSGNLFVLDVKILHLLILVSLLGISGAIIFDERILKLNKSNYYIYFLAFGVLAFTSYSRANLTQLYIILIASMAILIFYYASFLSNKGRSRKVLYFSIATLALKDLYASQVFRNSFLHLSLLCLVLTVFIALKTLAILYYKKINFFREKERLRGELKVASNFSEINNRVRQVIHDLKSPLTSLNFIVSSDKNKFIPIVSPLERIGEIINSANTGLDKFSADWFSLRLIEAIVKSLLLEKSSMLKESVIFNPVDLDTEVYIEPEKLKTIIAELIDNSVKHNENKTISVKFELFSEQHIVLKYSDNGVGIRKNIFSYVGIQGFSTSGTGLGTYMIKSNLESWGGEFKIISTNEGYSCLLKLQKR